MSLPYVRAGAAAALILMPVLTLITATIPACVDSRTIPVEVRFDIAADAAGAAGARILQFYIHDIEMLDAQGRAHAVRLAAAPPAQSEALALVELAGSLETRRHATLRGTVDSPSATWSGIRFSVGVPFALNHSNPLTAAAPLDRTELLWSWQSGYKFLRADLAIDGREWSFHLGSTGCSSASALRPPKEPCAQPNRMRVELAGDPRSRAIRFDLTPLVAAARSAKYAICTGNYAHDPACRAAYATTGLNIETGACADGECARQQLWRLE